MQASQIDQTPLVRDKTMDQANIIDPLVAGHSGGDVNDIGDSTTGKLTIDEYNKKVKIDSFKVNNTAQFLAEEQDDDDIDQVQSK